MVSIFVDSEGHKGNPSWVTPPCNFSFSLRSSAIKRASGGTLVPLIRPKIGGGCAPLDAWVCMALRLIEFEAALFGMSGIDAG
jgi:hypothetical protein